MRGDVPAGINALARGTLAKLLERRRAVVSEVVGRGRRDDGVPDDGLVGRRVGVGGGRPFGGDVDEDLLGIPGEEGGEVRVERELDDGVFFVLGGVVVGAAADAVGGTGS